MKHSLIALSFAALALSNPVEKRQVLDVGAYNAIPFIPDVAAPVGDAVPQTASYNPTSIASVAASAATAAAAASSTGIETILAARQASSATASCTTRSANAPSVTSPADRDAAFVANAAFTSAAIAAATVEAIPAGYALVPEFVNKQASAMDSHYLTYTTKGVSSYDPSICAAKCNAITGCMSFNMYYERVPAIIATDTQVPNTNCPGTVNSPSATLLKCAFYGVPIMASQATNVGQYQGKFHVVITGSNAYVKSSAPSIAGYEGPVSFGNASINIPAPVIDHGYLRIQTFGQNVPFDPTVCASSCASQSTYNQAHYVAPGLGPCNFFNVFLWYKDGQNPILTCTYYSSSWGPGYATNVGQYDQAGSHYTIANSYGYYANGYFTSTSYNDVGLTPAPASA